MDELWRYRRQVVQTYGEMDWVLERKRESMGVVDRVIIFWVVVVRKKETVPDMEPFKATERFGRPLL